MKEQMSNFDILAIVKEMQSIVGGYIDKIYQIDKDKFVIRINIPKLGKKEVFIDIKGWLFVLEREIEKTQTPSAFAMLLRKYLAGGKLISITQHELDRVVIFEIQKADIYRLIIELFGDGNLILTQNRAIIQPLISQTWEHRNIRAKEEYIFPPSRCNPLTLDKNTFTEILRSSERELVRTSALDMNLGGLYAEELCKVANIPKNVISVSLKTEDIETLFELMQELIKNIFDKSAPNIVWEKDKLLDVVPTKLAVYEINKTEIFETFNNAVNKFYFELKELTEEQRTDKTKDEIERLQRRIAQQTRTINEYIERQRKAQKIAELLYVYHVDVDKIVNTINTMKKETSWDVILKCFKGNNFVKEIRPNTGEVIVKLENKFEAILDFRKSITENAQYYYETAKKIKRKLEGAREALCRSNEILEQLTTISAIPRKKKEEKTTETFWFEKYRWFISSNGNIVIGGKDTKTNEAVVKKYLKEKDRYAHADTHGAPSVVIKDDREISEQTLKEACEFALVFSKAWNSKMGSGSAYWVLPEQVSKTPRSGEFVPKGGFIIRGKKNYIHKIKIEAAIGEIQYDNELKIMCGPVSAIKTQTKKFVVFEPGDVKKSDFSKELSKAFSFPVEEIVKVLPPGDVRIVESAGLELF